MTSAHDKSANNFPNIIQIGKLGQNNLTLFEVSILEVVYGVSQQPPGPVDEVDGAGELVVGLGHVVDVAYVDHADTGHVGVVDEGQAGLYENVLL